MGKLPNWVRIGLVILIGLLGGDVLGRLLIRGGPIRMVAAGALTVALFFLAIAVGSRSGQMALGPSGWRVTIALVGMGIICGIIYLLVRAHPGLGDYAPLAVVIAGLGILAKRIFGRGAGMGP